MCVDGMKRGMGAAMIDLTIKGTVRGEARSEPFSQDPP